MQEVLFTQDQCEALMVLAAVGDAMGYNNGDWQFNKSSKIIHLQLMQMTNRMGVNELTIDMSWRYSDDTVMHMATAQGLIKAYSKSFEQICQSIAAEYKACWKRMAGRAPGNTCGQAMKILNESGSSWNKIPYRQNGAGCGAAMRAACIGIPYYSNLQMLVAISIQSGRMTHHCPGGYLAAVMAAHFTALALRKIPATLWVAHFLDEAEPLCRNYIQKNGREAQLNLKSSSWDRYVKDTHTFAQMRGLPTTLKNVELPIEPKFPKPYGIRERDEFYHKISWGSWPGAVGFDSVMIAYDGFLGCEGKWDQLCLRAVLHGGDNDSTGTIAAAWFGAVFGFQSVPERHYKSMEDNVKIRNLGAVLFKLAKKIV